VIVATGALSVPTLGGSDRGYHLAQAFGLPLEDRSAGLVPFMFSDSMLALCNALSGCSVSVEARCGSTRFNEDMLFTHRGLSGPAILQISNYWRPGETLTINLLPSLDAETYLIERKSESPKQKIRSVLTQHLPKALVTELEKRWWPEFAEHALAECNDTMLRSLGQRLNTWQLKPSATEGYRTAEVTLGGVATSAISSKTMEAIAHPGLYFVGEVVDVTGHLGGFNFQWAWSSGFVAGVNA
jgi:predicted Rossmann fold flavoprotein